MEKVGVLITALLLTAGLVFYSNRSPSNVKTEQIKSQEWLVKSFPLKEGQKADLSPFFMKVKSQISIH